MKTILLVFFALFSVMACNQDKKSESDQTIQREEEVNRSDIEDTEQDDVLNRDSEIDRDILGEDELNLND